MSSSDAPARVDSGACEPLPDLVDLLFGELLRVTAEVTAGVEDDDMPMWPGMTTEAFKCGALSRKSESSASVKPFTANLAALYAVCGIPGPSDAQKPFTLLVLTTWPSVATNNIGMKTARVHR